MFYREKENPKERRKEGRQHVEHAEGYLAVPSVSQKMFANVILFFSCFGCCLKIKN